MTSSSLQSMVYSSLCQGLDRLYGDQELCDLTVHVGDKTFQCHRFLLAAVSQFFQSSLTSSWRESSSREVSIEHEDVTAETFSLLLDILYRCKEVVTMDNAKDILKMAIFLQVNCLENYCQQFLCENMASDNCLEIWQFAEQYELSSLSKAAFSRAVTDFQKVLESPEFVQLPKALLLRLLATQTTGETLCRVVFHWAEADVENRKQSLRELAPFINFAELSEEYLSTLLDYLDHAFKESVFQYITNAVKSKLNSKNPAKVRQLHSAYSTGTSKDFEDCVVIVTRGSESGKPQSAMQTVCFPIVALRVYKTYTLETPPEVCGFHYASCVWSNQMFVSGGSENPTFFAQYLTDANVWKVLPAMPEGREKHTMAAVSGVVYVVGGLQSGFVVDKVPATDVLAFDLRTKSWRVFCRLVLPVAEPAVAVLGHRVYVFGGQTGGGQATDVVQCVDTLTGAIYRAGRLLCQTSGARAVSDGGTIYLATDQGHVLRMKENYVLADRREETLAVPQTEAQAVSGGSEVDLHTASREECGVEPASTAATVSFVQIGQFEKSRHGFGAFLAGGRVVVCGGCTMGIPVHSEDSPEGTECNCAGTDERVPCQAIEELDLQSGKVSTLKRRTARLEQIFALNIVRIHKDLLIEDNATLQPLMTGDEVQLISTWGKRNRGCFINTTCIGRVTEVRTDDTVVVDFPNWPGYKGKISDFCLV